MIHDTQSAQISHKQDGRNVYAIMEVMSPPDYHYLSTSCAQVHELPKIHWGDNREHTLFW